MLNYIRSFFQMLTANTHPGDIAHAGAWAVLLALMPKNNLLWFFLFFLTLFIRINKGAFFLVFIGFGFIAPFFDGIINVTGYTVLSQKFLLPVYTRLYATPFVGLTMFNNTMVAGALCLGLLLYIPVYFFFRAFVYVYRKYIYVKIVRSTLVRLLLKVPIIRNIFNPLEILG